MSRSKIEIIRVESVDPLTIAPLVHECNGSLLSFFWDFGHCIRSYKNHLSKKPTYSDDNDYPFPSPLTGLLPSLLFIPFSSLIHLVDAFHITKIHGFKGRHKCNSKHPPLKLCSRWKSNRKKRRRKERTFSGGKTKTSLKKFFCCGL